MGELPRKRQESKQTWNRAKEYVLEQLKEKEEIPSPEMVKDLIERFNFTYEGAAYGVINALIQHNQIHYALMPQNYRMLYLGPAKGKVVIIKEHKKPEPKVEEEAMIVQDYQRGKTETPEQEEILQKVEEKKEVTPVQEMAKPVIAPPPARSDKHIDEEVDKVVKDVAIKTLIGIAESVDAELEKNISIPTRAKLKLAMNLAASSGLEVEIHEKPMEQRDAIKRFLEKNK